MQTPHATPRERPLLLLHLFLLDRNAFISCPGMVINRLHPSMLERACFLGMEHAESQFSLLGHKITWVLVDRMPACRLKGDHMAFFYQTRKMITWCFSFQSSNSKYIKKYE
jgi:hypothetical protein